MKRMNAQAKVRAALADALQGVEVRTSDPRPAELVVVRREGGGRMNALIDGPGIGIDVWAASEARACEIAHAASDAMASLRFEDGFAAVDEETLLSQYDTRAKSPHWYGSYTLRTFEP